VGQLTGKAAVITGGAGTIGLATGRLFAQEGAQVLLVDRDGAALEQAVDTFDSGAVSHAVADVTEPEQTEQYVRDALDRHGRIDVLVAAAGIVGGAAPIADYDVATFERVMAVNVRGVWLGLRAAIPPMAGTGGGSIIILSSVLGLKGAAAGLSAYVTSKHALVGLMRAAALECAPLGIRVNTIHPACVEGPMMRELEAAVVPGAPEVWRQKALSLVPLGRYCEPEEVAQTALFLASDASRFCTGGPTPWMAGGRPGDLGPSGRTGPEATWPAPECGPPPSGGPPWPAPSP
jgi:NAD(P)-dependent dehydrogenase (short-subunit alcohol dehydrogenase family)